VSLLLLGGATIVLVDVDVGLRQQELDDVAVAMHLQMQDHYGPIWGPRISVRAAITGEPLKPTDWKHSLVSKPTLDGALAYHDRNKFGVPTLFTFVKLAEQLGQSWTAAASHENLEAGTDPGLHATVELPDGRIASVEICDQVEQDTYKVGAIELSNFNTPENFTPPADLTAVTFDYLGLSKTAFETRPGGYCQIYDPAKGWTQEGQMSRYRAALRHEGISRGARRVRLSL